MTDKPQEELERRRHSRVRASYRIKLEVPVELEVELRSDDVSIQQFVAHGVTVNISQSGMLARIDQRVVEGADCSVHFLAAKEKLSPDVKQGKVHRVRVLRGGYEVAVEFETPLEILNAAGATAT